MNGWIKLHRSVMESQEWLSESFPRSMAWIDLLLLANHRDGYIRKSGQKILIKRGCIGFSIMELSIRWKWSRNKVYRWIQELQEDEQITIQQINKRTTLIFLVNYEKYQEKKTTDETSDGSSNGTTNETSCETATGTLNETSERHQKDIRRNTNKNVKKNKKDKKERSKYRSTDVDLVESPNPNPRNFQIFIDSWNAELTPKVVMLGDGRKSKLMTRQKDDPEFLTHFQVAIGKIKASSFLNGSHKSGWKATFDWLIENDKNYIKVIEGNYDEKSENQRLKEIYDAIK